MFFHELLKGFDLKTVLLLRHRPHEPEINEVLPWLAVQKPNVFNAYQQTQSERVEAAMIKLSGKGYIASFIGQKAKKATFAGLYRIGGMKELQFDDWWKIPEHDELRNYGQEGMTLDGKRKKVIWFDLQLDESFYAHWRGKLIIEWLPPERSWCRRAHKKHYPIHAILDESTFDPPKAQWDEIDYSWKQLEVLPHPVTPTPSGSIVIKRLAITQADLDSRISKKHRRDSHGRCSSRAPARTVRSPSAIACRERPCWRR